MLILTIRTDKPEAEIGLFDDDKKLAYRTWQAHRQLAETIHLKIKKLLESEKRVLNDLEGVIVFKGPGSFTGLRIGVSVANALADSLNIPIVGMSGDNWIQTAKAKIKTAETGQIVQPGYGSPPHTTKPKY